MSRFIYQINHHSSLSSIRDLLPKEYVKIKNMEKRILSVRFLCWKERDRE